MRKVWVQQNLTGWFVQHVGKVLEEGRDGTHHTHLWQLWAIRWSSAAAIGLRMGKGQLCGDKGGWKMVWGAWRMTWGWAKG